MDEGSGGPGIHPAVGDLPWRSENAVRFYRGHRHTPDELYPSERHFLPVIARPESHVLDIGCAAGGLSRILHDLEPSVRYAGIDISRRMIAGARACYPETPFLVARGDALPFRPGSFDTVISFGTLHMDLAWRDIIAEAWRVARDLMVFDVRLVDKGATVEDGRLSYEKIAFLGEWDGRSAVPYVVLNTADFLAAVRNLSPRPRVCQLFGYFHPVSPMAVTPFREVCMTACCLGRRESPGFRDRWEVPLDPRAAG